MPVDPVSPLLENALADKFRSAACNGLFKQGATRLLACDFEQTSEYWLTTEAGNPEKKALVLLNVEANFQRCYNGTGKALISSNGDGSEILDDQQLVVSDPGSYSALGSFWAAHTALVMMVPNSSLTLEFGAYKKSGFRSESSLARKNITVQTLKMRADGKLEWSK